MCWRMRGRRRGLLRSCHQSSPRHNPSIFCAVSALSSVHLGRCDSLQANLESTLPTWNQGPGHSGVAAAKKKLEPTLRRPKTHPTPTPACECSKPAPGRRITSHHIQHLTSHPSFDASTCRAALDRRPWDALLPSAAVARRLLPTGRDPRHLLWYVLTPRPAPPEKESNAPRLTSVAPRPIPPLQPSPPSIPFHLFWSRHLGITLLGTGRVSVRAQGLALCRHLNPPLRAWMWSRPHIAALLVVPCLAFVRGILVNLYWPGWTIVHDGVHSSRLIKSVEMALQLAALRGPPPCCPFHSLPWTISDPSEAQPRALSSKSPSLTNRKNLTSHPCLMLCPQASLSSTRDLTR